MHVSAIHNRTLLIEHQVPQGSYAGSLLIQHPIYNERGYVHGDKVFKEACCNPHLVNLTHLLCEEFVARRPTNDGCKYKAPDIGELYNKNVYEFLLLI